jgi:hypothetical protein
MFKDKLIPVYAIITHLDFMGDSVPCAVFTIRELAEAALQTEEFSHCDIKPEIVEREGVIEDGMIYIVSEGYEINKIS